MRTFPLNIRGNGGPIGRTHRARSVPIKGCLLEGRVVTYNVGRNKTKREARAAK